MFSLKDQLAKIVSCTNVSEKHGKERVPALSIGFYLVGPSRLLDSFDPTIRPGMFRKPMPKPGELPLESDDLTELRFPFMRNLAWDRKYEGYIFRLHIGASGNDDVLIGECGMKDIRFVLQEGGSVGIGFKITAHPKDEIDHGRVATRLQQEVIIDLTPPDKVPTLFDDDDVVDAEFDPERDPFEGSDLAQDDTRIDA